MTGTFTWTDAKVRDALGLPAGPQEPGPTFTGISTDTRTVGPGELFVALVGERFDGHDFLDEAQSRDVQGAVVSRPGGERGSLALYRVEDTLSALGALARYRRRALPARVAAVTGSSGKTTVKDLLAASLGGTFRVHATTGNRNNRVGVPLTLLSAPEAAEIVVLEMGTSLPGEIAALTAIAEPDAGLVTTVAEAHLEGLGSFEGVLEEKLALVRDARADALLVVGDDPPELPQRARELRPDVKVAGVSKRADPELRGDLQGPEADGRYTVRFWGREILAGIPGKHGVANLVLALAMARLLGADADSAVRGAAGIRGGKLRGEVRPLGGITLLLDCYNANPQSVSAALELLTEIPASGARVAVLASMLELGTRSSALHRQALEGALALPLDIVVAVGEFADAATGIGRGPSDRPRLLPAPTPEAGYRALRPHLAGSETVLLKGSRGMELERLVDRFEEDFGSGAAGPKGDA